jgi:hypothetical protein
LGGDQARIRISPEWLECPTNRADSNTEILVLY